MSLQRDYKLILVVEDEPSDRLLIEQAFRENGVTAPLHLVGDGAEAIAYMKGEGPYADRVKFPYPTLVMTDLKMPKADGFSVLEHLRNHPERAIIPTVVLTASSDPDDILRAYRLGASCYHVKPNSFGALKQLLGRLHEYWRSCLVPAVDETGKRLPTESRGKMGERFSQAEGGPLGAAGADGA